MRVCVTVLTSKNVAKMVMTEQTVTHEDVREVLHWKLVKLK